MERFEANQVERGGVEVGVPLEVNNIRAKVRQRFDNLEGSISPMLWRNVSLVVTDDDCALEDLDQVKKRIIGNLESNSRAGVSVIALQMLWEAALNGSDLTFWDIAKRAYCEDESLLNIECSEFPKVLNQRIIQAIEGLRRRLRKFPLEIEFKKFKGGVRTGERIAKFPGPSSEKFRRHYVALSNDWGKVQDNELRFFLLALYRAVTVNSTIRFEEFLQKLPNIGFRFEMEGRDERLEFVVKKLIELQAILNNGECFFRLGFDIDTRECSLRLVK